MIFAELEYDSEYSKVHEQLVRLLSKSFLNIEFGHQNDSWIWVLDDAERVSVDSFSSMKHQVKSARPGPHVQRVIKALETEFKVKVFESPVLEGDENL